VRTNILITTFLCLQLLAGNLYAASEKVGMVTGGPKGTYIKIGNDIASIVKEYGVDLLVKESKGSFDNVERMASNENAGIGIVQSDVISALRSSDIKVQRSNAERLRLIAPLYNEEVHIFGSQTIKNLSDLHHKKVAVGNKGGGTSMTAKILFTYLGIEPELLYISKDEALVKVLGNEIDAMIYVAGKPVNFFSELETFLKDYPKAFNKLHFVPARMSEFKDPLPYVDSVLTPKDYNWLKQDVPAIAVKALLVAYDFSRSDNAYHKTRCEQFGVIGQTLRDRLGYLQKTGNGHEKWKEVDLSVQVGDWQRDMCSWNVIGMVTGSNTGTYIKFGQHIADVAKQNKVFVEVKTSEGSVDNINRMNSKENAGIGIVQSDVIEMLRASSNRDDIKNAEQLRLIAPLYNEEIHLFANKSIRSLSDLNGKRVAVGNKDGGSSMTADILFATLNINPAKLYIEKDSALLKVFSGEIDAMIYVAGKPVTFFSQLDQYKKHYPDAFANTHFVPISLNNFKDPLPYVNSELSPSDYIWMSQSIPTIAVKSLLVSYDFYNSTGVYGNKRCQQLHDIAKSIQQNMPQLRTRHDKWQEVDLSETIGGWKVDQCAWGAPKKISISSKVTPPPAPSKPKHDPCANKPTAVAKAMCRRNLEES